MKQLLKRTKLFDFHVENFGKMVPFAGWEMPLQYKLGTIESHKLCRSSATIFDVSHMQQLEIKGEKRFDFIESLVPGNIKDLKIGQARLTQLTNDKGGIIDDTIITNKGDHLFQIVNAGCADKDWTHLTNEIKNWKGVSIQKVEGYSLIAIQGPKSKDIIQDLLKEDLTKLFFMNSKTFSFQGTKINITRCGYTGEDGFEIQISDQIVVEFVKKLLSYEITLSGLGARDTLRLEAGLCLMTHDMTEEITPIEADLSWTIGKRRKEEGNFKGAKFILEQLKNGVEKKRVGFILTGKTAAREGTKIFDNNGNEIGIVTSGGPSPSLDKPIGMGYVKTPFTKIGQKLFFNIRGKQIEGFISQMPFIPSGYYRG